MMNDNGGSATADDFTIALNGTGNTTFPGSETGTTYTFNDGYAYDVTETGPQVYAPTLTGDSPAPLRQAKTRSARSPTTTFSLS